MPEPDRTLDCSGLICPLPVLRARKAIRDLAPGGLLLLIATDPAAPRDVRAFCEATGHVLEQAEEGADSFRFLIRRA